MRNKLLATLLANFFLTTFSLPLFAATAEFEVTDPTTETFSTGFTSLPSSLNRLAGSGNTYNFFSQFFTPTQTGSYTLGTQSANFDTVLILYSGSYNPAAPQTNAVAINDDSSGAQFTPSYGLTHAGSCGVDTSYCSQIVADLTAGTRYHLVTTTYSREASIDGTIWFYLIGDRLFIVGGPDAASTLASMQRNASGLRKIFSFQASYVNPGLSYDCARFDKNGVCVGFSGRYTATSGNGPEAASGVLTAAYKINPNIRIGGFIEQFASDYSSGSIKVENNNPAFGIFGGWSQTDTDEGLKVRAAYRYGKQDLTITRDAIDTAELGSGTSKLVTEGGQLTASYGYSFSNTLLASPYVGIRYTNIRRNSYTELTSATVTTPLSYDTLRQETTSLLAGVSLSALVAPSVTVVGSVGIETDAERRVGKYSATGVADLAAIDFNRNTRKTRMVGAVSATYKIDNPQQISARAIYREEAYGKTTTTTGMITYTASF